MSTKMMKKTSRRRRKNVANGTRNVMLAGPTGIADSVRVRLTYEDLIQRAPGSYRDYYAFRGNSAYDPDYTSVGHQPRYYDTYGSIYAKYKVYGSSLTVEMINASNNNTTLFAIVPLSDVLSPAAFHEAAELPRARVSQIVPVASRYPQRLFHKAKTAAILGLDNAQLANDVYSGDVGANPTSIWYWNIVAYATDSATELLYNIRVTVTYDVLFYDRQDIPISVHRNPETRKKEVRVKRPDNISNQVVLVQS